VGSVDQIKIGFVNFLPNESDILSRLYTEIDNAKNVTNLDVLMLLGVSGSEKTRTAYDLVKKFYFFYFEVSHGSATDLGLLKATLAGKRPEFNHMSNVTDMEEMQDKFEKESAGHTAATFGPHDNPFPVFWNWST
jgi:hypothetical protein